MPSQRTSLPDDPLSRLYRDQVDVTLLRKNLTLTVEQRLRQLMDLQRFAAELRRAGHELRGRRTP
jgi:hypothetical protein